MTKNPGGGHPRVRNTPELDPKAKEVERLCQLGQQYMQSGNLNQALQVWEKAEELDPCNAGLQLVIAHICVKMGQLIQAKHACTVACAFDLSLDALEFLLKLYLEKFNDPNGALYVAERILEKNPGHNLAQKVIRDWESRGFLPIDDDIVGPTVEVEPSTEAEILRKAKTYPATWDIVLDPANPDYRTVGSDHPMTTFVSSLGGQSAGGTFSTLACTLGQAQYVIGIMFHSHLANPSLRFYPGARARDLTFNSLGKKYSVPDLEFVGQKSPVTTAFTRRSEGLGQDQGIPQTKHEKVTFLGSEFTRPWFGMVIPSIDTLMRLENVRVEHREVGLPPKGQEAHAHRCNLAEDLVNLSLDEFTRAKRAHFGSKGTAFRVEFLVADWKHAPCPEARFAIDNTCIFSYFGHVWWYPEIQQGVYCCCLPATI